MILTVIFHYGRCGSKALVRGIEALSSCVCLSELSERNPADGWTPLADLALVDSARAEAGTIRRGIEREIARRGHDGASHVIVEFKDLDIHTQKIACGLGSLGDFLGEMHADYVVHLRRRNLLKLHLSHLIARQTGVYHTGQETSGPVRLVLDTMYARIDLFSRFAVERAIEHSLARSGIHVIECVYEDHIEKNPIWGARWLLHQMGVDLRKIDAPDVPLKKTNPFPANRNIVNLEEVRGMLKGAGCEWMLD